MTIYSNLLYLKKVGTYALETEACFLCTRFILFTSGHDSESRVYCYIEIKQN